MSQQHDTINAVERQKGSSHSSEELTPTVQQVVDELIAALTQGGQAVLAAETTLEGVLAAARRALSCPLLTIEASYNLPHASMQPSLEPAARPAPHGSRLLRHATTRPCHR